MDQIEIHKTQKKHLIDNAVQGMTLSDVERKCLAYLLNDELEVVSNICSLIIKARMQGDKDRRKDNRS